MKRKESDNCWALVLAGGEGTRISSLIEECLGFRCPKQYFRFCGEKSMLEHTNSRAVELAGADRVITVIGKGHRRFLKDQRIRGQIIEQPVSRGTGAGVLLILTYLMEKDPEATVLIFPSDHFVYPRDQFLGLIEQAKQLSNRLKDKLVLVTALPDHPETDYGWVEPGPCLGISEGHLWPTVRAVRSFHEKPTREKAAEYLERGYFWNTMILACKAKTVWSLGHQLLPRVLGRFDLFRETLGGAQGRVGRWKRRAGLSALYQTIPSFDFSRAFLTRAPTRSVILPLDGVMWSDWGRPERVLETLRRIGKEPLFLTS